MKRLLFLAMLVALGGAGGASASDSSQALIAAWDAIESVKGRVTIRQHPDPGVAFGFTAKGSAVYLKSDGKVLTRQMLRYAADDGSAEYAITNVYDGVAQWMMRPGDSGMDVYKMPRRVDPADFLAHADWQMLFATLSETAKLHWGADETIDGETVRVLDVTLIDPLPGAATRSRSYFSKAHGVPVKAVAYGAQDHVLYEWSLYIEAINQPIPPETFAVTVPSNAQLYDLTGETDER